MFREAFSLVIIRANRFIQTIARPAFNQFNHRLYSTQDNETMPMDVADRKVKIIKTEILYLHEDGHDMPQIDEITDKEWKKLLSIDQNKRQKFYRELYIWQRVRETDLVKEKIRKAYSQEQKEQTARERQENEHIIYGLNNNTLLPRIRPDTIAKWRHRKICRSLLQNSQLIFDCGFEHLMTDKELHKFVNQVRASLIDNRLHKTPFYPHLTNLPIGSNLHNKLLKVIPPKYPLQICEQLVPEGIANERLVYLTPDSNNTLRQFNGDDVYIIGGLVDLSGQKCASLATAKAHGLRTARLPIGQMGRAKKFIDPSLPLNHVMYTLLEFKRTRDIHKAMGYLMCREKNTIFDANVDAETCK